MAKVMVQTRCPKCGQRLEIEVWVDERNPHSVMSQLQHEIELK